MEVAGVIMSRALAILKTRELVRRRRGEDRELSAGKTSRCEEQLIA